MPIYEYQCNACGYEFEVMQRMSDDPLLDCPKCSQPKLQKLVSAASFRLKGQGWYETDFKQDNRRQLDDSGGESTETGQPSKDTSAEPASAGDKQSSEKGAESVEASQSKTQDKKVEQASTQSATPSNKTNGSSSVSDGQ